MNSYFPLHIYTGYSFFKSSIKVEDLIFKCKENNYEFVGISDINNLYAYPLFNKIALKNNIKPIFGIEVTIEDYTFSLYIKNEEGYLSLIKLTNLLSKNENKIKLEDLTSLKGVIFILSSSSSAFNKINEDLFKEKIEIIKNKVADFYIGLDNHEFINQNKINVIREFAKLFNIKCLPFSLYRTIKKEDSSVLKILDAIENNYTITKDELNVDSYHFLNNEEINNLFYEEEINNLNDFVKKIDFSLIKKRGELINYTKVNDESISSDEKLKELILKGLKEKDIDLNDKPIYRNRLNYEYKIITSMGFSNYFLIVQDYINFAKSNNILVGPGRGSAAGSLIAYLLKITDVDPIKYDLLFERFLNPLRNTMPDIDLDFQDVRREEIVTYLENKYGNEHIARVIAFQNIKAKNSIRDISRIFGYPVNVADSINKKIPEKYKNKDGSVDYKLDECYQDLKSFREYINSTEDYRKIFQYAKLIEGLPRQIGLHAAGIVISEPSLLESMPINFINEKEIRTQYEKDYLEDQGFLKFDILGLSNLTTIANCLYLINKGRNLSIKFDDIPLEDKKIYDLLKNGYLMGLFQIDASAGRLAILEIKPDNFKEVVDAISLARPGPLEYLPNYVARKNKKERINYPSKDLIPILSSTYGIIIYQEQIMKISQKYSSFSFGEADLFRKAISKKHKDEILKMKEKFINGAIKNNHSFKEANDIFEMILKFASYGFNQSHAVAYAMITVKMAYLKAYYPLEFYASILSSNSNDAKFNNYLSEIKERNYKISLPDINNSSLIFIPYKNSLIFPLSKIKDVPANLAYSIIKERKTRGKYKNFKDFINRSVNFETKLNEKNLSSLIDSGVFDSFNSNRQQLKEIIPDALKIVDSKSDKLLLYVQSENESDDFNYKDVKENPLDKMQFELKALGILISSTLIDHLSLTDYEKKSIVKYNEIKTNAYIVGTIDSIKVITLKSGKNAGSNMAFIKISDTSSSVELVAFTKIYETYNDLIKENKIILFNVKKERNNNKDSYIINSMKELSLNE